MNNKGFTIIELILVISVMAMLTIFMLPNIKHVRDKTKEMAERSVMSKAQGLLETYYYDNGHYLESESTAADFFKVFKEAGYITKVPKNPFTGSEFTSTDKEGQIVYTPKSGSYLLTAYKQDGTTVLAQIESE